MTHGCRYIKYTPSDRQREKEFHIFIFVKIKQTKH